MIKKKDITKIIDAIKEVAKVEDGKRSLIALGTCIGTGVAGIVAYTVKHKKESWYLCGISAASYFIGAYYANKYNNAVEAAIGIDTVDYTEDTYCADQNT